MRATAAERSTVAFESRQNESAIGTGAASGEPTIEAAPPSPIDIHVGARIRLRRKMLGTTQQQLADAVGLTFQQIQKYERGMNRVSASKLYAIAAALRTSISYFFEGLPDPVELASHEELPPNSPPLQPSFEGLQVADFFTQIAAPGVRRNVLALIRALAEPV